MEPTQLTRVQATIATPAFVDSLFANPPVDLFNDGVLEAGRSTWLFHHLDEPGPAARDVPVNELAVKMPPSERLNIAEKPTRIEQWT